MDKDSESFYVKELELQSVLAMNAFESVGNSLQHLHEWDTASKGWAGWQNLFGLVFRNVHSFLTHSSNVSKLFWPEVSSSVPRDEEKRARRQRTIDRGEHLKTTYHITSASPLASRALRNHLDHFDERLDDFLHEISTAGFTSGRGDMHIGVQPTNLDPKFVLRHLDDVHAKFIFRGEEYELRSVADAVMQVLTTSREIIATY